MSTFTDYLTGIADAIRTKKGTAGAIPASSFAAEIIGLETSSGINIFSTDMNPIPMTATVGFHLNATPMDLEYAVGPIFAVNGTEMALGLTATTLIPV